MLMLFSTLSGPAAPLSNICCKLAVSVGPRSGRFDRALLEAPAVAPQVLPQRRCLHDLGGVIPSVRYNTSCTRLLLARMVLPSCACVIEVSLKWLRATVRQG